MKHIRLFVMTAIWLAAATVGRAEEEFRIQGDAEKGAALYKMYCALCHGETGHGDGPGAAALNPKPRTLAEKAYMDTLSDKHLFTVIKDGGPAVGKSMFMTAFGAILKEDQAIHDVAAFVRSLAVE
ncbi:MAG TPA: cytochrome c [Kiritimatiellia bacterium]|nr:cytochrome c [Kiritimatiellia bacterium]HMP00103.1 cytochrome c [Kiritimatiellia bacterium]HMP96644.1 cytochrome c [Kiritimatiellia bacterium]